MNLLAIIRYLQFFNIFVHIFLTFFKAKILLQKLISFAFLPALRLTVQQKLKISDTTQINFAS